MPQPKRPNGWQSRHWRGRPRNRVLRAPGKRNMASALPETSPERYLTGTSALSIPTDEGDVADWHFDVAFLRQGTRFRVAGVNIPSTQKILGQEGIREYSGRKTVLCGHLCSSDIGSRTHDNQ